MGCQCSNMKVDAVESLEIADAARAVPENPVLLGKRSSSKLDLSQDITISRTETNDSCHARCNIALETSDIRDLDVRLLSYTCLNEKTSEALGPGCCEITWKVQAGQNSMPTSILMHVDRSNPGTPKVVITSDGLVSTCKMAKINGDLRQKWRFTGTIEGAHKINYFETWVAQHKDWLPATLIQEMSDGRYAMDTALPDGEGSLKRVVFQAVKDDIRYASSHKPFHAREHILMLKVPEQDPSHAILSVDGFDLVPRFFARPSPPVFAPSRSLHLQVSQDQSHVLANMGDSALADFMQAEVRAVKHEWHPDSDGEFKHSWIIQAGYFAEHVIQIEGSRLDQGYFVLAVDGETLAAASRHDLGCDSDWECSFHLVGARSIDFDLHEMSQDDSSLENISSTSHKQHFFHECRVVVHETRAGKTAELFVDGINFAALPGLLISEDEPLVHLTLDELNTRYGLQISLTGLYSFSP